MATITTDTYLDDAVRTAGEAWTINSDATLTVRTDTRVHANAPAGNLGSLGSVTINEGSMIWDSTAVRIVPFDTGSGNVPAIGTTITQGGVSGYLLGVWADWASAQTAVGAAMPATGFLKFREVTDGAFAVGTLTGIGASATDISVQGWIEIVMDSATVVVVPRIGSHRVRGGRFYIGVTDGTVGQQFQVPSMGSTVQVGPGAFVETSPDSANTDDDYEIWPGIVGWSHIDVGGPFGGTDRRQNFLKAVPGGILQMGEAWEASTTYASIAAQASTYVSNAYSATYRWENDEVLVYYGSGHGVEQGDPVGLEFTSGGAVGSSAIFTATVLSPYHLSVSLTGSGSAGNVTIRHTITITFTAHTVGVFDEVHCNFTSGSGVDGYYVCNAIPTANTYRIIYPSIIAITSGNVSVVHSLTLPLSSHGLSIGQQVYLDFASGDGVDGIFTIRSTPSVDSFTVLFHNATVTSGNVTIKRTIGNIAPAGCRVWIPSNIFTECDVANRAINILTNAVLSNRPEWETVGGGVIDFEYVYGSSGYLNFSRAYSINLFNSMGFDQIQIDSSAAGYTIDRVGMGGSGEDRSSYNWCLLLRSIKAAGILQSSKFLHGRIASVYNNALYMDYTNDAIIRNNTFITLKYTRPGSTNTVSIVGCKDIDFDGNFCVNGGVTQGVNKQLVIKDLDFTSRVNGKTNLLNAQSAVASTGTTTDSEINGITFGFNGEIRDVHPLSQAVQISFFTDSKIRNINTDNCGSFIPNLYGMQQAFYSSGNAYEVKIDRCSFSRLSLRLYQLSQSDSNIEFNNISGFGSLYTNGGFNMSNKSVRGVVSVYGTASLYGTDFYSTFIGDGYGLIILRFNEPTEDTLPRYSIVSGNPKFDGGGGLLMHAVGDSVIFRDSDFRKGYTAFENSAPVMIGVTITNYALQYRIDTGTGFSIWKDMTGSNLSGETITPTTGFKMEWSIETLTANTSTIEYLSVSMLTTPEAQATLYPLDIITLTIPGLVSGSDVVIYEAGTYNILASVDAYSGTSWNYVYETPQAIDISIIKSGYYLKRILNFQLPDTDSSIPDVGQTATTCNV